MQPVDEADISRQESFGLPERVMMSKELKAALASISDNGLSVVQAKKSNRSHTTLALDCFNISES